MPHLFMSQQTNGFETTHPQYNHTDSAIAML